MSKIKISELAKELGVESKEVVSFLQEKGVELRLFSEQGFIIGGAHDHEPADVVFKDARDLHRGGLGPAQGDLKGAPHGQVVFFRHPPLDQDALVRGGKGLFRLPVVQAVHPLDGGDVPHIQLAQLARHTARCRRTGSPQPDLWHA